MRQRALFLDRDGIVNDLVFYPSHGEWESPRELADLRLRPDAIQSLLAAQRAGWLLFLITNQPSYAKGKCSLESLKRVHQSLLDELARAGVNIKASYVCYHHPDSTIEGFGACDCRKPSPQSLLAASREHDIDLARSWMIGDQAMDIETGRRAGCRTALVEYEHSQAKRGGSKPDLVSASLAELIGKLD